MDTFFQTLTNRIQQNCTLSDAQNNGIYSMCTLFLRLRNLYKWEQGLQPWEEPASSELIGWIETKENLWLDIHSGTFSALPLPEGDEVDPFNYHAVNRAIHDHNSVYGAGYGRSMKAIFFLAELENHTTVEGIPVYISGRELARELSSPFAMHLEDAIYIRRESMRYFYWDQIQDVRSSTRESLQKALSQYGVCDDEHKISWTKLRERLDHIVDDEIPTIIHHEIGEAQPSPFGETTFHEIIAAFPATPIEILLRALKDVLADTHDKGMLSYIIGARKEVSYCFFLTFLDGMRKLLFPGLCSVHQAATPNEQWRLLEKARLQCREMNMQRADLIVRAWQQSGQNDPDRFRKIIEKDILEPLGIQRESDHQSASTD